MLELAKNNLFRYVKEGKVINPNYATMKAMAELYQCNTFLNITVAEMDKYISLTRFGYGRDKVVCDWCAIANGTAELFLHKLQIYCNTRFNPQEFSSFCIPKYFNYLITLDVRNDLAHQRAIEAEVRTFGVTNLKAQKVLRTFIQTIKAIEYIETRWCPFKYLIEIPFNRPYYYYDPYNVKHLQFAQKLLRQQGKITCNNCIQVLNSVPELRTATPSIFTNYLTYLHDIVTGKETETIPPEPSTFPMSYILLLFIIVLSICLYNQI